MAAQAAANRKGCLAVMSDQLKNRDKMDLLRIQPFPNQAYEHYSLTSLTAYSVFWLQEWNMGTSLNNVAVANYRLFPLKFALVGWPQFPDVNRTSRSILQMRPKYRNFATSATDKGVFLNQNGTREAQALIQKIGCPALEGEQQLAVPAVMIRPERGGKARSVHTEDFVAAIEGSQLYELYSQSRFDESEAIHFIEMLGVYDHTPSIEKKRKLKELQDAAKDLENKIVAKFLEEVEVRFQKYLNR